jgi:hypothetical protein
MGNQDMSGHRGKQEEKTKGPHKRPRKLNQSSPPIKITAPVEYVKSSMVICSTIQKLGLL